MRHYCFKAPAKLNLSLQVNGRRPDGYHLLDSIFVFINIYDFLSFHRIKGKTEIRLTAADAIVPVQDNLIGRAFNLLRDYCGFEAAIACVLQKNIPVGGGMGGGSSDAATTLIALNHILSLGLKTEELAALGLKLGADIPFFIKGHNARVQGIGEIITPVTLPVRYFVILYPRIIISTRLIFQNLVLTPRESIRIIDNPRGADAYNDLQTTTFNLYPELGKYYDWLSQFGQVRMTGSGSCLYVEAPSEAAAKRIISAPPPGTAVFYGQTLNHSPMLEFMR